MNQSRKRQLFKSLKVRDESHKNYPKTTYPSIVYQPPKKWHFHQVQPNVVNCTSAISACGRGQLWRLAMRLAFQELQQLHMAPDTVSWH